MLVLQIAGGILVALFALVLLPFLPGILGRIFVGIVTAALVVYVFGKMMVG